MERSLVQECYMYITECHTESTFSSHITLTIGKPVIRLIPTFKQGLECPLGQNLTRRILTVATRDVVMKPAYSSTASGLCYISILTICISY